MPPLRLVWRYLWVHPVRSGLTLCSIVAATFLLCVLRGLIVSITAGVDAASASRLIVQSAVSLFVDLPHSYQSKIDGVEGVEMTSKWTWFGGVYQDPSNFFAQFGVDVDRLLPLYPEMTIVDGDYEEFRRRRNGCVIGKSLVERFGWQVGDSVPIEGTIFPRSDGSAWEFEVCAVYASTTTSVDEGILFFDHEYLTESVDSGDAQGPDGVSIYVIKVAQGAEPTAVMANVDAMFANGPQVVQTTTEREFNRQFVSMLGNVPTLLGSIGGGVLFAILLASVNTMVMAGRERTRDLGVLKALGFGDGTAFGLLLCEGLLLCSGGGLLGVGLALATEPLMKAALAATFPLYAVSLEVQLMGIGLAVSLGLLAGAIPALQAMRLRPVEALRAEV